MSEIKNRYEFTLLFDVQNGNANGDPDADNMPRVDDETGIGLVTDVCLKRKIRNYVDIVKKDSENYKIYVRENVPLDGSRKWAYEESKVAISKKLTDEPEKEDFIKVKNFMCDNFYDVRAFGAVMTLKYNCGQVRGPVQLGFAKSMDVINPMEIGITSCTYANEGEKSSKMGNKKIVPYALYRVDGYVSPNFANRETGGTGFSEEDVELLWSALINMFDFDHSAARGNMASRELVVFKHDSIFGNCPAYKLFEAINVEKKADVSVPRKYSDYEVKIDEAKIPEGVTMKRMI